MPFRSARFRLWSIFSEFFNQKSNVIPSKLKVDECIGYCSLTLGRLAAVSSSRSQPTILWAEVLPFDEDNGVWLFFLKIVTLKSILIRMDSANYFSPSPICQKPNGWLSIFSRRAICECPKALEAIFSRVNNLIVRIFPNTLFSAIAIRATLFVQRSDRRPKRKKTSSKRIAKNAQFNESLTFQMPKNSLCDSILEIEVINIPNNAFPI